MTVASISVTGDDMEVLLPWYATGALETGVARRIDELLRRDAAFASKLGQIHDEIAETVLANEELGAPSLQAMNNLFAAIDAEPARAVSAQSGFAAMIAAFFASLSPRTLMYSASVAALAFIVQGGVIGSLMMNAPIAGQQQLSAPVTSSAPAVSSAVAPAPSPAASGPLTRSLTADGQIESGVKVQIRFEPDTKMSDIAQFLSANSASVVAGPKGGTFTVRFGNTAMSKDDIAALVRSLERERIVSAISIAQ